MTRPKKLMRWGVFVRHKRGSKPRYVVLEYTPDQLDGRGSLSTSHYTNKLVYIGIDQKYAKAEADRRNGGTTHA